jgi:hypothetical protein
MAIGTELGRARPGKSGSASLILRHRPDAFPRPATIEKPTIKKKARTDEGPGFYQYQVFSRMPFSDVATNVFIWLPRRTRLC